MTTSLARLDYCIMTAYNNDCILSEFPFITEVGPGKAHFMGYQTTALMMNGVVICEFGASNFCIVPLPSYFWK